MPAVLRRINRIFRRNSRDRDNNANGNNSNNAQMAANNRNPHPSNYNHRNDNSENLNVIKLRSSGYQRQSDGSVTLSVTLDKDQVECCVCLSSMTSKIYRCRGHSTSNTPTNTNKKLVCHNICSQCQWQMRRMKSGNGHTKEMQCPICKVKGSFIRNRALERQLLELSKECIHAKHGCLHRFFPWDDNKELHEKHLCIYQSIDCPFCNQTICGGRVNFIQHLAKSSMDKPAPVSVSKEDNDNGNDQLPQEINAINDELNDEMNEINEMNESENDPDFDPNSENSNDSTEADMNDMADNEELSADNQDLIDEELDELDDNDESEESDEEEQKQALNDEIDADNDMNEVSDYDISIADNSIEVPPCLIQWYESKSSADATQNQRNIIQRSRNEFIVSFNLGIILCFVCPTEDCECWKVYTFSISPRHSIGGNSRVYVQYYNDDLMTKFITKEQSLGLITQSLCRPITNTLIVTLSRLHPTTMRKLFNSYPSSNPFMSDASMNMDIVNNESGTDIDMTEEEIGELEEYKPCEFLGTSPCADIQCGFIFGGNVKYGGSDNLITNLGIRLFTLEESFKVGSVIDARDFTGKWYQAEVIAVKDCDGNEFNNLDCDNDEYLEMRRAKIHYLGYSQNYDEWLNVDTDSHRIAQRGTFTVGPDLRAIRKNTTNLHTQNSNANNQNNQQNSNVISNTNVSLHRVSIRNHRNNRRTGNNQQNNIEFDEED